MKKNAVKTFESFIEKGNSLVLTANVRRSNLISDLYQKYSIQDVNVVDLTQLSKLALNEKFSFESYTGGQKNES